MERVNSTLLKCGPILREASDYGMNVQESLSYIDNVRSALSKDDIVTAAKYARRVREKTDAIEKELDQKRLECGHAFQKSPPAVVEKAVEAPKDIVEESATGGTVEKDQPQRRVVAEKSPEKVSDKKKKGFFRW
jgi:hypothetical protein